MDKDVHDYDVVRVKKIEMVVVACYFCVYKHDKYRNDNQTDEIIGYYCSHHVWVSQWPKIRYPHIIPKWCPLKDA